MSNNTAQIADRLPRNKGRENRTQSIATRFTRAEEQALLRQAEASGQNLREWARDVMLRGEAVGRHSEMEMHIFTELVGIQMLLMNTLEPLLRGDKIAQDQLAILFRQVQTTKAAKAQELLAKRSQKQEK
ncbi:MAG: plasmid mobilization protein [Terriglobales bacterium]